MAAAYVKEIATSTRSAGSGTTAPIAVTSAPGAGNMVVALCTQTNFTLSSVSDQKGNTWALAKQTATGGNPISIFYTLQDIGTLTTADTITLNFAGSVANYSCLIEEFSGVSASPVDQVASGTFTTTTVRSCGSTASTTQANEVIVACFGVGSTGETAFTPGASYTAFTTAFLKNANGNCSIMGEFQIVSSTGIFAPTGTGGATLSGNGVTATFTAVGPNSGWQDLGVLLSAHSI